MSKSAKKISVLMTMAAMVLMAPSAWALNNDNVGVTKVETSQNQVLVHFDRNLTNTCTNGFRTVAGCRLSDAHCESILRIALSARLSRQPVDLDVQSGACLSGQVTRISRITRFRIRE